MATRLWLNEEPMPMPQWKRELINKRRLRAHGLLTPYNVNNLSSHHVDKTRNVFKSIVAAFDMSTSVTTITNASVITSAPNTVLSSFITSTAETTTNTSNAISSASKRTISSEKITSSLTKATTTGLGKPTANISKTTTSRKNTTNTCTDISKRSSYYNYYVLKPDFHLQCHCGTCVLSTSWKIPIDSAAVVNADASMEFATAQPRSQTVDNMKLVGEFVVRNNGDIKSRRVNGFLNNNRSSINDTARNNYLKHVAEMNVAKRANLFDRKNKFSKGSNKFATGFKMKERNTFLSPVQMYCKEEDVTSDSSEELHYGPGIVNKLKTKYLSMTLRENQKKGIRPSLRKATSLDNLLEGNSDPGYVNSVADFVHKIEYKKTEFIENNVDISHNRLRCDMKRARSMEALNENLHVGEPNDITATFTFKDEPNSVNNEPRVTHSSNTIPKIPRKDMNCHIFSKVTDKDVNYTYNVPKTTVKNIMNSSHSGSKAVLKNINSSRNITENFANAPIAMKENGVTENQDVVKEVLESTELPPTDVVKETLKLFEGCKSPKLSSSAKKKAQIPKLSNKHKGVPVKLTNNVEVHKPIVNKPNMYPKPLICPDKPRFNNDYKNIKNSSINVSKTNNFSKVNSSNCVGSIKSNSNNKNMAEINGDSNCTNVKNRTTISNLTVIPNGVLESKCITHINSTSNLEVNENIVLKEIHSSPVSILKVNFEVNNTISHTTVNHLTCAASNTDKIISKENTVVSRDIELCNGKDDSIEILKTSMSISKQYSTPLYINTEKCPLMPVTDDKINKPVTVPSPVRQIGIIRPLLSTKCNNTPLVINETEQVNIKYSLEDEKPNQNTGTDFDILYNNNNDELTEDKSGNDSSVMENIESNKSTSKPNNLAINKPSALWSKKPWNHQENTMVFNFKDRKEVPDYIENDGLLLGCRNRTKRIRENIGNSGIILLNDMNGEITDNWESSTDGPGFDNSYKDEDWQLIAGPPSPCNVQFEGDNILINGKSNIRKQSTERKKLSIQFNDTSTTYEYPSEASFLDENSFSNKYVEEANLSTEYASPTSISKVPSVIGGSNLANYVPSKLGIGDSFELGVTRSSVAISTSLNANAANNKHQNIHNGEVFGVEENEHYLKPAEETVNVAWSEDSIPDLLF